MAGWSAIDRDGLKWAGNVKQSGVPANADDLITKEYGDATYLVSGTIDHSTLTNLNYAAAGHTGFQETITAGTGIDISGAIISASMAAIDHNLLLNTHNLTTDIDHNSITNTHNLTTDIDHNSITNTHDLTTDIDHTSIQNIGTNSHASIDTHIASSAIHFTEAAIDHANIQNIGTNTHSAIDTHIASSAIHFTEASIDHTKIQNVGTNAHSAIDTHIASSAIHFTAASIDHTAIQNIGTNAHSAIDTHIASGAIHTIMPAGVITCYGGAAAPTGWLLCDGTSYLRADYGALYTAIGVAFGSADGTHFNVPNFAIRSPMGLGGAPRDVLGYTGGNINHAHTGPSHTHTGPSHTHTTAGHQLSVAEMPSHGLHGTQSQTDSTGAQQTIKWATTTNYGGDASHEHGATGSGGTGATGADGTGATGTSDPPYIIVNFIIKT